MKEAKTIQGEALLKQLPPGSVRFKEPLAAHTTFQIGGPCDVWIEPSDVATLTKVMQLSQALSIPIFVLGKGSNLLVSDAGIAGAVLSLERLQEVVIQDDCVYCQAGVPLSDLCDAVADAGLHGLEFACGIPGTLGGAIYMNAGAYDGEMKDVVTSVDVMYPDGKFETIPAADMGFSYRHSRLKEEPLLCVGATFRLQQADVSSVREKMDALMNERRAKQPLEWPSAGSTFKRPPGYFAGKLIIDAGMQGHRVGDAEVSTKHAGFIVNRGKATARDVADLIHAVQAAVKQHAGVDLEPEVRFVGRW